MRKPRGLTLLLVALVLAPTAVLAGLSSSAVEGYRAEVGARMRRDLNEMQGTLHALARAVAEEDQLHGQTRARLAARHVADRLPFEAPSTVFEETQFAWRDAGALWAPDRLHLRVIDAGGRTVVPARYDPETSPPGSDRERLLADLRRRADAALFGAGDVAAAQRIWADARERFADDGLKALADVEQAWLRARASATPAAAEDASDVLLRTWPQEILGAVGRTWVLLTLAAIPEGHLDSNGVLTRLVRDGTLDRVPLTDEERARVDRATRGRKKGAPKDGVTDVWTGPLPAGLTLEVRRTLPEHRTLAAYVLAEARRRWPAEPAVPTLLIPDGTIAVAQARGDEARVHDLLLPGGTGTQVLVVHPEAAGLAERIATRRRWTIAGIAALLVLVALGLHLTLRALAREREARRLKDDFLANVSHELRTPLTSVCLHADLLAEGPLPDDERRAHAEVVRAEGGRLAALVEDLLDFAARERGARPLDPAPVDVGRAVTRAVEPFRVLAGREGVALIVEPGVGEVGAFADSLALERILANLLGNAWKHGRPSRDGAPGRIRITVDAGAAGAGVTVRDDGPGIPATERGALFERFHRGAGAIKTRGVGLGLALSRDLARAMGGDLVLLSDPDATVFRLTLPPVPPVVLEPGESVA